MMLGKSIISNASKVQDKGVDKDVLKIDWPEDSIENSKIITIKTQSMMGNVEAVSKRFLTGIVEVAEAYTAVIKEASVGSQEVLPLRSIQEKANAFSENLPSDQTTPTGKVQDGLQYLSYVVVLTLMPAA